MASAARINRAGEDRVDTVGVKVRYIIVSGVFAMQKLIGRPIRKSENHDGTRRWGF